MLYGILGQEPPAKYTIGGESYRLDDLVRDFADIALSEHMWLDDADEDTRKTAEYSVGKRTQEECETKRDMQPIVTEYLCRTHGFPISHAITKWSGEITIGIDWQRVEVRQAHDGATKEIPAPGFNLWGQEHPEIYPLFKEQILAIAPSIERLTGLPVIFVDPSEAREVTTVDSPQDAAKQLHARIRIVPTRLIGSRTRIPEGGHGPHTWEPYFLYGVPFTPFEIGQVDGYILPNADNTIGFAACRINPDLPEILIRALITECLVRVVGLPDLSQVNRGAAIGHWNKRVADYLEDRVRQVENAGKTRGAAQVAILRDTSAASLPGALVNTHGLENGFSLYDRFMIALLYCPDITPGMNRYDVLRVLKSPDRCFRNSQDRMEK